MMTVDSKMDSSMVGGAESRGRMASFVFGSNESRDDFLRSPYLALNAFAAVVVVLVEFLEDFFDDFLSNLASSTCKASLVLRSLVRISLITLSLFFISLYFASLICLLSPLL